MPLTGGGMEFMMFVISQNRDSDYSIILRRNASPSEKTAMKELKKYLFQISGAMLPHYTEGYSETAHEIVLGYTSHGGYTEEDIRELGEEGFLIKNEAEKIFILGSSVRGVLYGVYTFLEKILGCRFYTNDFEKIPRKETLALENFCLKETPVFEYRNSYWFPVTDEKISAKLKINGCHGREISPEYGGGIVYVGGFEHTIGWLSGQCPEGERAWTQPCLCDEKVYQTVIGNIRKKLEQHPDARLVSITQNDGTTGACQCEKCRKINEPAGSDMGTMLSFVNRIADELGSEYPNLKFDTFAYRSTRRPPKGIVPRDNVIIRLCSIECCFRHPIEECSETPGHPELTDKFSDDLLAWSKLAKNLYVWNYTTDFTNFPVLYPNFAALRKDAAFFARHGAQGLFEQGNYASPNGEFGELRGYLLARLLWDPYMSQETYENYIKEFLSDYYGRGGKAVGEYLLAAHQHSEDSHFGIYFDNPTLYVYNHDCPTRLEGAYDFAAKGDELFDRAEKEAENDIVLAHIRRSRIQLIDYKLFICRDHINELEQQPGNEEKIAELKAEIVSLNRKIFEYMRKYGITHNCEFHPMEEVSEPDFSGVSFLWRTDDELEADGKK